MNHHNVSESTIRSRLSQLKGYIFEVVVRKWLENNGFEIVNYDPVCPYNRQNRANFLEIRGRGCWHQIDAAMDYKSDVPFVNKIRLLSEVKFLGSVVTKVEMREFIGVIKDITENYVVPVEENITRRCISALYDKRSDKSYGVDTILASSQLYQTLVLKERFTEIGVFFSSSGFSGEAEHLAYAHNISTISYKSNPLVKNITEIIQRIASEDLPYEHCLSQGNHNEFMASIYNLLSETPNYDYFIHRFQVDNAFLDQVRVLQESLLRIRTTFIATTSAGTLLHFISENLFPDKLFLNSDTASSMVNFEGDSINVSFYMVIIGDKKNSRFYFTPPRSLIDSIPKPRETVYDEKMKYFREITIQRNINGVRRTLTLTLDIQKIIDNDISKKVYGYLTKYDKP